MAKDDDTPIQTLKIISLCILWYTFSSSNSIVGKVVLSDFPYPMTVTMVQLLSISLYVIPVMKLWNIPVRQPLTTKYWIQMVIPLAFGKFFSSVTSHISIWKVPVSYVHTIKATMPLFTVFVSRIFMGEKQTMKIYLSLFIIVGGVIIATLTELSFEIVGLISALLSTFGFALQNVFSKQCLKQTKMHQFQLLFLLARLSGIMFAPLWFWYDCFSIIQDSSLWKSYHTPRIIALLLIDGFCNFSQNLCAFTIIALLTPLSYSVANTAKRIAVVSISLITLKNPVTPTNVFGMFAAIFGVSLYNKIKYDQHIKFRKENILPLVKSTGNINGHALIKDLPRSHTNILLNIDNENSQNNIITKLLQDKTESAENNRISITNVNTTFYI